MAKSEYKPCLIAKLVFSFLSFIFFLILLELSLRAAGAVFNYGRSHHTVYEYEWGTQQILALKDRYVILCLGDSYTVGGEGSYEDTYPQQLQTLINRKNESNKYTVVNEGVCESNSREIYLRLPALIDKYNPDMIILLAGAANRFNHLGYDIIANNKVFSEDFIYGSYDRNKLYTKHRFLNGLQKLRISKMGKIILLNLKTRQLKHEVLKTTRLNDNLDDLLVNFYFHKNIFQKLDKGQIKTKFELMWYYFNLNKKDKATEECQKLIKEYSAFQDKSLNLEQLHITLMYFYLHSNQLEKGLIELDSFNSKYANKLSRLNPLLISAFYTKYGEFFIKNNKYDLATESFCKAILVDPFFTNVTLWQHYLLAKAYSFQNEYNSKSILDFYTRVIDTNPAAVDNGIFISYYNYWKNIDAQTDIFDKLFYEDLENIVKLANKNKIKLIIMNYPYPYKKVNQTLESIAVYYALDFIDNYQGFSQRVTLDTYKQYFLDDDHCTVLGHKLLAQNIYAVIAPIFSINNK